MKATPRRPLLLLFSFLIPAAVMTAVFALCALAPFGDRTLGVMDMSHQYLSFLYSLRDILTGRANLNYLPSMCLGGNMLGVFAYYLVSPLNLLLCLFPRESLLTGVSLLYILRVGLCGLTMCVYAGARRGWSPRCLAASLAYSFMAYMVAYSFNYLWQECVILLPLIALGIARLREGHSPRLYIIALGASLLLNFYMGYILCLFSVLFFLFELFSEPLTAGDGWKKPVLRFLLGSLAAGGLAAVLLLPAFLSLRTGKASFSLSALTAELRFTLPALLSKLYPAAFRYEEIMPEGLPQIFCGTVTMSLTILYFVNRAVSRRRRLLAGGLMLILLVSFAVNGLDLIWHGLNAPTWYNYRYSFLLSFLMAAAADRELKEREGTRPWQFLLPPVLIAAASALVFWGRSYAYVTWHSALAAVGVSLLMSGALLLASRPRAGRRFAAALGACVLLLHGGELAANAGISLARLTAQSTSREGFAAYTAAKAEAFAALEPGRELVRTESDSAYSQNRCEPMLFGYDGLSHFGSTLSQASLDFLDGLGLDRYEEIWVQYGPGVTAAADTLLGVRYLVTNTLTKPYEVLGTAGDYTLAENPDALPLGWTAPESFRTPAGGESDCFSRLNALYAAAAPELGEAVFLPAGTGEPAAENFTRSGNRFTRVDTGPASVIYTVTPAADGPLYAEFAIPEYPGVTLFADGVLRAWTATAQTNGSVYLGDYAAGQTVTVTLQAAQDITVERASFATESARALARYAAALKTGGCPLTKISASHYIGSFTAPEGDGLLVLTIPWDDAWSVTLDGVPVRTEKVQGCLTALSVTPGAHTVELTYRPAGLVPGGMISLLTLGACLAVHFRSRRKK